MLIPVELSVPSRLGFAVVAVALGIAGCDSNRALITSTVPPYTEGTISAIDPALGYLVEGRGSGVPPRAYVRLRSTTELRWEDDRPATPGDLTVGRFVEAWSDGAVIDSQPPRTVARFIRVFSRPLP